MKLFRFGEVENEKCGVLVNGEYMSAARLFRNYDEKFFENGGLARLEDIVNRGGQGLSKIVKPESIRFAPPVGRPSKIVCIGLNFADHVRETNAEMPKEPVIFFKASTSFCGPNDPIIIPKNSVKTDWEVELAVVIGKKASYVDEKDALSYVAGYCLHNDVSEREFQLERGGTWDKGKGCDSFAPMGPFLVTPDEIEDVNNLKMWLKVNGEMLQNSNSNQLIFKIPHLISYVSQFMTLLPGDIISTGTPPGVGLGFNPPRYLKSGDVVELGIEGLGEARQVCKNYGE